MTKILIVDASESDRRQMSGLLVKFDYVMIIDGALSGDK